MDRRALKKLLQQVRAGQIGVERALDQLRIWPVDDLGFARVDTHRAVRTGFPEVVYGPGKTAEQIVGIVGSLGRAGQTVLVTRVGPEVFEVVRQAEPRAEYHETARAVVVRHGRRRAGRPGVVVVTAGTADLPVGEEAALTAELMGQAVVRVHDVGVAGIHRLFGHRQTLSEARVIVVVAGMEGALPSVVAGLVDCPIIGVPTSTGYGAGAGGQAALLAMLNSCAAGLTVVNIDNGFGAGFAAAMINRQTSRRRSRS
jgi:NCAIR mutase (PurE)-related protein